MAGVDGADGVGGGYLFDHRVRRSSKTASEEKSVVTVWSMEPVRRETGIAGSAEGRRCTGISATERCAPIRPGREGAS